MGVEGDLPAFFKHVQANPARLFPNTDAGRPAYIDEATEKSGDTAMNVFASVAHALACVIGTEARDRLGNACRRIRQITWPNWVGIEPVL